MENNKVVTFSSIPVEVIDTTGAGDTFNGILSTYLSRQCSLREAVKCASIGASLSITKLGAQTGMPTTKELEQAIKKYTMN